MLPRQVRTRAEVLAEHIEAQIRDGQFRSGDIIGTIDDLKKQSGYARSTVGEAIRLLSDRGIADVRPGRGGGIYVKDGPTTVRIGNTLLSVSSNPHAVADAIQVREALEALIDIDAARNRSDEDIVALRERLDALRVSLSHSLNDFLAKNWELHARIAQISSNVLARELYANMLHFIGSHATLAENQDRANDEVYLGLRYRVHEELVEAIAAGDTHRTHLAVLAHRGVSILA